MSEQNESAGAPWEKLDFRAWTDRERHLGSVIVIIAVAVILVAGIGLQFAAPEAADAALWALVGLVVLALAYQGGIVWFGLRAESLNGDVAGAVAGAEAGHAGVEDAEAAKWAPPAPVAPPDDGDESENEVVEPEILTLRCGDCRTEFDVEDHGVRPLYHTCPGCGAEGVLQGESAPDAEPGDALADEEVPDAPVPAPEPETPPAEETPAEAPAVRHVKLRCGGCKHVFRLEDTGERPLRNRCPSCGRLGEIR